ncbi:MAG: hypothetical protein K0S61_529 [Anaerocolumna sp.]|jgi:glycosyltransferase involved in cell wall biosynthesis|nr:hypothetical protein [Anaerocolumna sp.]
MLKPLISVIVPIYNTQDYLARCVDSIREQTYSNIEIILVNDGSTDKSPSICDNYALIDRRISAIHKINGGISDARNHGLEVAKGEYVTFIDSDDFIHPKFIKFLLYHCLKDECEIAACGLLKGSGVEFIDTLKPCTRIYTKTEAFLSRKIKSGIVGKLYKTSLFDELRFPVSDHFNYEDEALTYRLIYGCNRICITTRELYYYFQSPSSTTRNTKHFQSIDFYGILKERCKFFAAKEKELLEYSYEYACLCLMLFFLNCSKDKDNTNDKEEILLIFENYYFKMLNSDITPLKYKLMFTTFYLAPKMTAFGVNKLRLR